MTLLQVSISLFLASIISVALMQLYLSNKRQYLQAEEFLRSQLDIQWVSDLLSDSIRRAGFTPCLSIDQLKTVDSRAPAKVIKGLYEEKRPWQLIGINRMSEHFTTVLDVPNSTHLVVMDAFLSKVPRPILIADCEHAEVHQVAKIAKLARGYLLTLNKPLVFSYDSKAYVGQWLEEQWFIKPNIQKENALHYKLFQTEEVTPLVHAMTLKIQRSHEKLLVELAMALDNDKTHNFVVAVRGS